jgi:hypothetical protein
LASISLFTRSGFRCSISARDALLLLLLQPMRVPQLLLAAQLDRQPRVFLDQPLILSPSRA